MNNVINLPNNMNISLVNLFNNFVNKRALIIELTKLGLPDAELYFAMVVNNESMLNLLIQKQRLPYLLTALQNIHAIHISNIITKAIKNSVIHLYASNMTYAFKIQYNVECTNAVLTFFKNNVDETLLNLLLNNEMISNEIFDELINCINLQSSVNNNHVGVVLLDHIKYYSDEDIETYWFPLLTIDIIDIIMSV